MKKSEELDGKMMMNVVVTSYEIAMNDRAAFSSIKWRYIVVDEGHRLKNMNCRLIRELKQYHSANMLLLTGIVVDDFFYSGLCLCSRMFAILGRVNWRVVFHGS